MTPARYRQNSAVESAPLERGLVVLEPSSRVFCALNQTSTLIWARLREPATAEQLAEYLVQNFDRVTSLEALRDVHAILEDMASLGIVVSDVVS